MKVKTALDHVDQITNICDRIVDFYENHPELVHASLTDAMACFEIDWEGVAHSSIADTYGCRKVWEKLFPNYYID